MGRPVSQAHRQDEPARCEACLQARILRYRLEGACQSAETRGASQADLHESFAFNLDWAYGAAHRACIAASCRTVCASEQISAHGIVECPQFRTRGGFAPSESTNGDLRIRSER